MNWDDLRYILALYRGGSLSAAARDLSVNHATVSRRLTGLEDKIGTRLFDRLSDGLHVTPAGTHVVRAAEQIEHHIHELDVAILGQDHAMQGPLKVSAPQLIIHYVLAPMLKQFLALYPDIELSIVSTSDEVNLYRREADVALFAGDHPAGTLWGRKIAQQNGGIYGAKSYLNARPSEQPLACLNFIWHRSRIDGEIAKYYDDCQIAAHFDDMGAVLGAVKQGMGVARMPCFLGDAHKDLIRLPKTALAPYYDLWLLTHPDLRHVTRIQTFMRFIAQEFKHQQAYLFGEKG